MARFSPEPNPSENEEKWIALMTERAIDYGQITGEDVTQDAHQALEVVRAGFERLRTEASKGLIGVTGPLEERLGSHIVAETIAFDREVVAPPFEVSERRRISVKNPKQIRHTFTLETLLDSRQEGAPIPRGFTFSKAYQDMSDPRGRYFSYSAKLLMNRMKDGSHEWIGTLKIPTVNRFMGRDPSVTDPLTVYDLEQINKDLFFAWQKINEG